MQKTLNHSCDSLLLHMDVIQGWEVLDGRNKVWGIESFHHPMMVEKVKVFFSLFQSLMLSFDWDGLIESDVE